MLFEQKLSPNEITDRRVLTSKVVNHTCSHSPWNTIISRVVLFGSLGRNSGRLNSDADVAFISSPMYIPTMSIYTDLTASLIYQINECREIYNAVFIVNPFLVLDSWNEPGAKSYLQPYILKAINEGTRIWPM